MDFEIHPAARTAINSVAADALALVEKITTERQDHARKQSWPPIPTLTITDEDIVGDPVLWLPLQSGGRAFVFHFKHGDKFGLSPENYKKVEQLCDNILKTKWARTSVSEGFIIDCFVSWAREGLLGCSQSKFADHFISTCEREVAEKTVWAPVQHLLVEHAFDFGRARIVPLDDDFFNELKTLAVSHNPDRAGEVPEFVEIIRSRMKRWSAVETKIFAEPKYAAARALQLCEDTIGLLRFFSRATFGSEMMSPVTLLDALSIPITNVLIADPKGISYSQSSDVSGVDTWVLRRGAIAKLTREGLSAVGGLIDVDELNDFGKTVRSSILAFTRAITFPELADRLVFAFSAIEGLMLRNQSEPIQQNVGERVAFLIATEPDDRQAIVENIRAAYGMRSRYVHHRVSSLDVQELDETFINIREALSCAVNNLDKFRTHDDFIAAIERRKFGG